MKNREIQHKKWGSFLDDFSRSHLGQRVTVKVLAGEQEPRTLANDLPLVGLVLDNKSSEGALIEIIAGESPDANVVHEVRHPSHVRVAHASDGKGDILELESDEHSKTIVNVRPNEPVARVAG